MEIPRDSIISVALVRDARLKVVKIKKFSFLIAKDKQLNQHSYSKSSLEIRLFWSGLEVQENLNHRCILIFSRCSSGGLNGGEGD